MKTGHFEMVTVLLAPMILMDTYKAFWMLKQYYQTQKIEICSHVADIMVGKTDD